MIAIALEAVLEVLLGAARWLLRLIPGVAANAAVAMVDVPTGRGGSRRRRRSLRAIVADGRAAEVALAYEGLAPTPEHRDARIDMLEVLADHDRAAAEPVLRAATRDDDPWVTLAALVRIEKHRMVGLRDAVEGTATRDGPRNVRAFARDVLGKLDRRDPAGDAGATTGAGA